MLQQGKEAAFEALYRRYIGDLLAYGSRMGVEEDVLKDLVQDLFIEIWRSRENLSTLDNAKFYLFKALRYKMLRHHHRANSAVPLQEDYIIAEESVESRILNAEQEGLTSRQIRQAIERLPRRQQEIIHLRYFQGFTNREIALLLNLQYQSTANLVHRSLQSMKQYLRTPILPLLWTFLVAVFSS